MPMILTLADYASLRTAAVRAPRNQKARETYARLGLVAGMLGISMAKAQKSLDSGDLPPHARNILLGPGYQFWGQVVKGANASLKGRIVDEASETQPSLKGVSGEDMAQIFAVGGQKLPGMRFDGTLRTYPDAKRGTKAAELFGRFVDRDRPAFGSGTNIFMSVGAKGRGGEKEPGWFSQTLFRDSRTLTRSWVRSVRAFNYTPLPEREREMEMLVPGYDGPGNLDAMNLSNPYFINAIDDAVSRRVSGKPTQEWLWDVITQATSEGNEPLLRAVKDQTLPLTLKATALVKWVEANNYPVPEGVGGRKALTRSWPKLYKQMLAAYNDLDAKTIQRGMTKGPASQMFRDPDVRDVYLQEIRRRRASSHRVAAKWAGLLDPVEKGLLDVLKHSPTQSSIIGDEDMRAATALVQKGLAEWFTDFELALTDQGRRKRVVATAYR